MESEQDTVKVETEKVEQVAKSPFDKELLSEDNYQSYLANLDREIKETEEKILFHKNVLIDLAEDKRARLENHDIMVAKFVPLQPHWEFENDKTYQKNLSILQAMIKKRDINQYEANEKQIQTTIEVGEEQLKDLTSARTRALAERK